MVVVSVVTVVDVRVAVVVSGGVGVVSNAVTVVDVPVDVVLVAVVVEVHALHMTGHVFLAKSPSSFTSKQSSFGILEPHEADSAAPKHDPGLYVVVVNVYVVLVVTVVPVVVGVRVVVVVAVAVVVVVAVSVTVVPVAVVVVAVLVVVAVVVDTVVVADVVVVVVPVDVIEVVERQVPQSNGHALRANVPRPLLSTQFLRRTSRPQMESSFLP